MNEVFICYRRDDSVYVCDRIYSALVNKPGIDYVFRDINSIGPGNWCMQLDEALERCNVLLAVMGKRWLTHTDEHGTRSIDIPEDYVVKELKTALDSTILVIPVLLEDIHPPKINELPGEIAELPNQLAYKLRPGDDFDNDMTKVINRILAYNHPATPVADEIRLTHTNNMKFHPVPNAALGVPLTRESNEKLLTSIKRLFHTHPELSKIVDKQVVEGIGIAGVRTEDFLITFDPKRDNGNSILVVRLEDHKKRLTMDALEWRLNLLRFSRQREGFVELYHNGDNTLQSPFREGSYGRNAPNSIVRYAVKQFPELKSTDPDLVYLGTLVLEDDLSEEVFADVRRRLAIYRFARWLWLWHHPLRQM